VELTVKTTFKFDKNQILLSASIALCVVSIGDDAWSRNEVRPPSMANPAARPAARPATRPATKKTTPKAVAKPVQKKVETTKKNVKPIETKVTLPTDEGPADAPVVIPSNRPPEPNPEANKVSSLFPNAAVAHVTDDPTMRLMVTINGTKCQKEADELMRLEKGSILISPEHKLAVATPVCKIELQGGAIVSIDSTSDTTYIRDFHDRWKGHVIVKTGSNEYRLMPGSELIITKETDPEKAWKNAVRHQIRRRDLSKYDSSKDITVYRGDFSIPDAMLKSNHFILLRESDDGKARTIIDEVTKTAALLHLTDNKGPFTLMQ